jgi:RNA recognition motif-containing protein
MKLYVGNLPYETTDAELEQLFSEFGTVKYAEIQHNGRSGRSRGFGYVEMSTPEEGEAAIKAMHQKTYQDRALTVNESRPRPSVRSLADSGWGGWGGRS